MVGSSGLSFRVSPRESLGWFTGWSLMPVSGCHGGLLGWCFWNRLRNLEIGICSVTALAVEVKAEEASPTCHNLHANRIPAIIVRTNPTPTSIIIGVIGNPPPFWMGKGHMCLFNSAKSRVPKDLAFDTNFCASDLFISTNLNWYHRPMYYSDSYISLNSRKYFHLGSISLMTAWSDLAGMKTLELNPSHPFPT